MGLAPATPACHVTTTAESPFIILEASPRWFATWKFEPAEAIGSSIKLLNGCGYDQAASLEVAAQLVVEQHLQQGGVRQLAVVRRRGGRAAAMAVRAAPRARSSASARDPSCGSP